MQIIKKFNVEGMSCSHCERAVKNPINELSGILEVDVDLAGKTVTVKYDEILVTEKALAEAIEEAGYEVV